MLGTKKKKPFIATPKTQVMTPKNELLFITNAMFYEGQNRFRACYGVGIVMKILKGDKFDLIYMNLGRGIGESTLRKIVVEKANARKQIYTLKVNQFAQVVGEFRNYATKGENGYKYEGVIYADALNGWYVPKSFDRNHFEDIESIDEMSEEETNEFENALDQWEKEKK